MKSAKTILISLFILLSAGLNAQVFLGGNVNLALSGGKNGNDSKKTSEFDFNLTPKIGTFLSDKVAIGIEINFGYSTTNNNHEIETITKTVRSGVSPFLRYYAVSAGKFSVYGQANAGVAFSTSDTKFGNNMVTEAKQNSVGISFFPGVSYELSERISLETSINFLNLHYNMTTETDENNNKETDSIFGLGAGLDGIVNTGNISVGAIFRF